MKKRLITALLVATGVFGAVVGLAASLGVTSDQLGSGSATVSSCDTTVNTAFGYDGDGGIDEVTVEGILDGSALLNSGACDGETVYVELLDTNGDIIGTATGSAVNTGDAVDATDDVVVVSLGGSAPAADVEEARVTITG